MILTPASSTGRRSITAKSAIEAAMFLRQESATRRKFNRSDESHDASVDINRERAGEMETGNSRNGRP